MPAGCENLTPCVRPLTENKCDDQVVDPFSKRGIYDLIKNIADPEHPLTLEDLHVVAEDLITVSDENNEVLVQFTPTIPHCSMATLIGLSIKVKLMRSLPPRFKLSVEITQGSHVAEAAVNKQLADKERVAAAMENRQLAEVINQCISNDDDDDNTDDTT